MQGFKLVAHHRDSMDGSVRRTELSKYLARQTVSAIYSPPAQARQQVIAQFARKSYLNKVSYDGYYNAADRSRMYCSEFVVGALESAGSDPVPLRQRSPNPSLEVFYDWMKIRDSSFYFVHDLIANGHQLALVSKTLSSQQITTYFELRRELFRRFTPDQKLGNIVRWTGLGVAYRPKVANFMQRGLQFDFRKRKTDEPVRQWVQVLANSIFGEMR